MISPINFGEKDPIVEFAKELRKTSEPENWRLAKKLEPKMRVFAPVIVRGEEKKELVTGNLENKFTKNYLVISKLTKIIGDFTDVVTGLI
jgi:hypothetical protein